MKVYEAGKPGGDTEGKCARHLEDLVRERKGDTALMDQCVAATQPAGADRFVDCVNANRSCLQTFYRCFWPYMYILYTCVCMKVQLCFSYIFGWEIVFHVLPWHGLFVFVYLYVFVWPLCFCLTFVFLFVWRGSPPYLRVIKLYLRSDGGWCLGTRACVSFVMFLCRPNHLFRVNPI